MLKDPQRSPADASRAMGISRPAVTKRLRQLRLAGLVRRRAGVKGAGSYELTEEGLRVLAANLPEMPHQGDHRGCLIIRPKVREAHHFKPTFYVRTPFLKDFGWTRTSRPPNEFFHWRDNYEVELDGEHITVSTIRFIDSKDPDKKRLTFYLDPVKVTKERTYEAAMQLLVERAYKLAAHIQRAYGCQLSLVELPEAPHLVLDSDPEVAATLIAAGISTDYVRADASDRIGQPHVEATSLEYALVDATAPHHIKYLYEKERQTQVAGYKLRDKVAEIEKYYTHALVSLHELLQLVIKSTDKIAEQKIREQLEVESKALEAIEHIKNGTKPTEPERGMYG